MGTAEGDERRHHGNSNQKKSNVHSRDAANQQIDCQFSPGGTLEGDEADGFFNILNMMPFDDTYLFEGAFETQMVNLAGETQAVDLDGETEMVDLAEETQMYDLAEETQMVDLAGETQMVDLYEETQVADLDGETQVLDDFNAEIGDVTECGRTNKPDATFETPRSSGDDFSKIDGSVSVGPENKVDKEQPKEESSWRGFTSLRAASIRASGLAALARGTSRDLSTMGSNKSSLEQQSSELDSSSLVGHVSKSGKKSDEESLENGCNDESERNSNKYKIGSTAVRKLFREDQDTEVGTSETEINQTDDNLDTRELLASESSLAGLSYANSQEPGELSQARALEVVDKFLDLSFMEYDEGVGKRVQNVKTPKVISAAKGARDLAKRSTLQHTVGECEVYDWDDAREDDGGGEFFLKKKDFFFDNKCPKQRCLTEPRKSKSVRDSVDKVKQCTKKLGDLFYSDSGLHKLRSKRKPLHSGEEELQKNLMKNLDERLHEVSGPEFSDNGADKDIPDIRNIGPDTQMAVEAMGDLCFEVHLADSNNSGDKDVHSMGKAAKQNKLRNRTAHSEEHLPYSTSVGVVTRQAKRTKRISTRNSSESSLSPNQCQITKKTHDRVLGEAEQRRLSGVNVSTYHGTESTGQRSEKCYMEDQLDFSVPVAHRTPKSTKLNCSKVAASSVNATDAINDPVSAHACRIRTAARHKNAVTMTIEEVKKVGLTRLNQSNKTRVGIPSTFDNKVVGNLQGKRSRQETLVDTLHSERLRTSSEVAVSIPINTDKDHSNHPSLCLDSKSRKIISRKTVDARNSRNDAALCNSGRLNEKSILDNAVDTSTSKQGDDKSYDEASAEGAERNGRREVTPRCRNSSSTCATPATRTTLGNNVSPICMGDEYLKQSCRKNLSAFSLMREIDNLHTGSPGPNCGMRESRKRKDITAIRVLFSQHLDVDVLKQQKKILARLGGAVSSSMLDATHFVADEFVRTRNMLEAIAFGKPVVTRLWIESCGQASCLIDEKNYILRDAKKEKEFGFCLPVSLARARQHPLLQGQKVFVTPNTKPGKDILANLVKAVHGSPVERLGRSAFKDKLPDDLLILSCEDDYEACVPFLEKGGAIYSSELLLNGIVKQKLEYERHRLFADHVKRTRSTMWLKKRNKFLPVAK
ncbi:BRCT domain-containing DNA repair protein [Perilla frutescens var. hirtella]|nr:BRCT domain-containing DNA repair protein [Perilla frutescens var. frutescens]KAH6788065.1 BRCT domain-containing DNA repair protein [Perilla frutescens var. hirtella]